VSLFSVSGPLPPLDEVPVPPLADPPAVPVDDEVIVELVDVVVVPVVEVVELVELDVVGGTTVVVDVEVSSPPQPATGSAMAAPATSARALVRGLTSGR
jgi:hypothetical protein